MKKIYQTLIVSFFVILITATFAFAASSISPSAPFPYFNIGCLIMGGLTIISLKHRYPKIFLSEAIGSFALYTILVSIFSIPFIDALKNLIS